MAENKVLQSRLMLCAKDAATWAENASKVLMKGEIGLETDTKKFKVGDGTSEWSALDYWYGTDTNINTHYTTKLILGDSDDTSDATSSVSNPYIRLFDDTTFRSDIQFSAGHALEVKGINGVVTTSHLNSTGYKHIPSGGSANKILRWKADGEAQWGDDNNTTYTITEGSNGYSFTLTPSSGSATTITFGSAAAKSAVTTIASGEEGVPTADAVYKYVAGLIGASDAIVFKGTIGTGGTITSLPTTVQPGNAYKAVSNFNLTASQSYTGAQVSVEVGDLVIATSTTGKWVVIPSGDESETFIATTSTASNVNIGTTLKTGNLYLGNAAAKIVDESTMTSSSINLPTAKAVAAYVSTASVAHATTADKDSKDQNIADTYIKDLSVSGRTITYTKGDGDTGTITTQDNDTWIAMKGATASAAGTAGYVPAPSAGDTRIRFLNANGTWSNVPTMTGATSSAAGAVGLVPAPTTSNRGQFLRGDGTWATPTNTTYGVATTTALGLVKSSTATNDVSVNGTTGVMTVNNINISKLTQDTGQFLVLNGNFF